MPEPDDAKRLRLRHWRRVALGALIVAGLLFIVGRLLETEHPAWGWVRAFGEAALIGALADWFAVVALFRHPMGIPFYHTAIVRRNQGRIAEAIGAFFMRHFWERNVLTRLLAGRRLSLFAAAWLEEQREPWATRAPEVVVQLAASLPPETFDRLAQDFAGRVLSSVHPGPTAARLLESLLEPATQQELIHATLPLIATAISENRPFLEAKIREEIPLPEEIPLRVGAFRIPAEAAGEWFKSAKQTIAAYVAERVLEKTGQVLREVETDPQHPLRQAVASRLKRLAHEWHADPAWNDTLSDWRNRLLASPAWQEIVSSLAARASQTLRQASETPLANPLTELATRLITDTANRLRDPAGWGGQWDALLESRLVDTALAHRETVHTLLVDTVHDWPADKISDQLELEIGADLQFVRLNGTLVGGAIGLALHAIGLWLG